MDTKENTQNFKIIREVEGYIETQQTISEYDFNGGNFSDGNLEQGRVEGATFALEKMRTNYMRHLYLLYHARVKLLDDDKASGLCNYIWNELTLNGIDPDKDFPVSY